MQRQVSRIQIVVDVVLAWLYAAQGLVSRPFCSWSISSNFIEWLKTYRWVIPAPGRYRVQVLEAGAQGIDTRGLPATAWRIEFLRHVVRCERYAEAVYPARQINRTVGGSHVCPRHSTCRAQGRASLAGPA
jgi:hypothetical protein